MFESSDTDLMSTAESPGSRSGIKANDSSGPLSGDATVRLFTFKLYRRTPFSEVLGVAAFYQRVRLVEFVI